MSEDLSNHPSSFFADEVKVTIIQENINRGEKAIEEGNVVSHEEVKKRLARWLD